MHLPSDPGLAELDELDHQALDLLDELDCGPAWLAARQGEPASMAALERALDDLGESLGRVDAAVARVRPLLIGLVAHVAASVVDAAVRLATTEDRGQLDSAALCALRERMNARPECGTGMRWAIELTLEILGFSRDSIAWVLVERLPEELAGDRDADTATIAALGERLEAARFGPAPRSKHLRVFRSAALAVAGPSLRAATLATEHPEAIALALRLVQAHDDAERLVEHFDAALAATQGPSSPEPLANIDGPKRKFTIVHVILAAIVLGLTLWHYVWR